MIRNWFKKMFREEGEKLIDEKIEQSFRVKFLEGMQKLSIRDGDTLVLKHPGCLNRETRTGLEEAVKDLLSRYGYNIHVWVLEEGIDIGVLSNDNSHLDGEAVCSCVEKAK